MIPKIIHYCWFGGNKLPESAIRCIESWKKFCPDYKIIEWNESNYNVRKNKYMSDAYDKKKWAFVSDYARVDVVYEHGGIYMDTDVELLKPLDAFLNNEIYCGWESRDMMQDGKGMENSVNFGLGFGAEKESKILKDILELYEDISFINQDGSLNLMACPHYQTMILKKYGIDDSKRTYQKINGIVVYPERYFSPKSLQTGELTITEDTVSIHHFSMSWVDKKTLFLHNIKLKLTKIIGYKNVKKLVDIIYSPYRIIKRMKK